MKYTHSRRKPLNYGLLYAILDKNVIDKNNLDIFALTKKLAHYGTDFFQLRADDITDNDLLKLAKKLAQIIRRKKKFFIVNNRIDIAYLSNSDGIHLGRNDILPNEARKILGKKSIVGVTVHSSQELTYFKNQKIDYISIGPAFRTKTKPDLNPLSNQEIKFLLKKSNKLTFAIGGINRYNIDSLAVTGVKNIASCRGIILSKEMKKDILEYKKCLRKTL